MPPRLLFIVIFVLTVVAHPVFAQDGSGDEPLDLDVVFDLESGSDDAQDTRPNPIRLQDLSDASHILPANATWKGAFVDSMRLLFLEHGVRIAFQEKTRQELGGPFFRDYRRSLRMPSTWEDGDSWIVNYVGHPIHGAASGFIWLDHEDGSHDPAIGFSRPYWASRARATAWAAGYSIQFEFGLLSEASIGNVGMRPETSGWVDHVVTPAGSLAFMVAEDALDRYFIRRVESWTPNRVLRAAARMLFNPSRTMSNTAQGRVPWARVGRPLGWREASHGSAPRVPEAWSAERTEPGTGDPR